MNPTRNFMHAIEPTITLYAYLLIQYMQSCCSCAHAVTNDVVAYLAVGSKSGQFAGAGDNDYHCCCIGGSVSTGEVWLRPIHQRQSIQDQAGHRLHRAALVQSAHGIRWHSGIAHLCRARSDNLLMESGGIQVHAHFNQASFDILVMVSVQSLVHRQ